MFQIYDMYVKTVDVLTVLATSHEYALDLDANKLACTADTPLPKSLKADTSSRCWQETDLNFEDSPATSLQR